MKCLREIVPLLPCSEGRIQGACQGEFTEPWGFHVRRGVLVYQHSRQSPNIFLGDGRSNRSEDECSLARPCYDERRLVHFKGSSSCLLVPTFRQRVNDAGPQVSPPLPNRTVDQPSRQGRLCVETREPPKSFLMLPRRLERLQSCPELHQTLTTGLNLEKIIHRRQYNVPQRTSNGLGFQQRNPARCAEVKARRRAGQWLVLPTDLDGVAQATEHDVWKESTRPRRP